MKMMKKVTVILASMVLLGTAAFAKNTSIGLTLSLPIDKVTTTSSYSGVSASAVDTYNTFGVGIINITKSAYFSVDLSFLSKWTLDYPTGNVSVKGSELKDAGINMLFLNMLGGYALNIIDTGTMQLVLAPGIHYFLQSTSYSSERDLAFYLGVGADALFKYYFTSNLAAVAGISFAYDFWGMNTENATSSYVKYKNIAFVPRIGIGFDY